MNWFTRLFHHNSVVHPTTGALINTSTLTQTPSIPSPAQTFPLPETPVSNSPYPIVVLGDIYGCTADETAMVDNAFAHLNQIIASKNFLTAVTNMQVTEEYINDTTEAQLTNRQVYALLVSSSPIKVNFSMFDGSWSQNHIARTQGYEDDNYPGTVFANRYFMEGVDYCASLILHEVAHVVGFHHYKVMATSVPYTFNAIYDTVAQQLGVEKPNS